MSGVGYAAPEAKQKTLVQHIARVAVVADSERHQVRVGSQ